MTIMQTLIKWPGGKTKEYKYIKDLMPNFDRYIEPFFGGGGIFSALIVLPIMGLPVEIIALLISIEPLIDMARTALNVNGAMVTGTIANRLLKLPTEESTT